MSSEMTYLNGRTYSLNIGTGDVLVLAGRRGNIPSRAMPMLHRRDCGTKPSQEWPSLTSERTPEWLLEYIIQTLWEVEVEAVATGTARKIFFCERCMCSRHKMTSRGGCSP